MDEYIKRNLETLEKVDKLIEEGVVYGIVVSRDSLQVFKAHEDFVEKSITGRYKGVRIIVEDYFPAENIVILRWNDIMKVNLPCICGWDKHLK